MINELTNLLNEISYIEESYEPETRVIIKFNGLKEPVTIKAQNFLNFIWYEGAPYPAHLDRNNRITRKTILTINAIIYPQIVHNLEAKNGTRKRARNIKK